MAILILLATLLAAVGGTSHAHGSFQSENGCTVCATAHNPVVVTPTVVELAIENLASEIETEAGEASVFSSHGLVSLRGPPAR